MIDPLSLSALAAMMGPTAAMVCPMQDDAEALKAVEQIIAEFEEEQQSFYTRIQEAESDEERQKIFQEGSPDPSVHFEKMHAIAKKHPGSDAAAEAANWVMSMSGRGPGGGAEWAMEMMLTDFIDSEHIANVPFMCSGLTSQNVKALERIRAVSKVDRARAVADYMRATQLISLSKAAAEIHEPGSSGDPYVRYYMQGMDDDLKETLRSPGVADEYRQAGLDLLAHCAKTYSEVEYYPGSGVMIAAKADGELFEMHNLQIGDTAPDITGVDAEGVEFSLSDYKGQVIVLDFWGFW